VRVGIVSTNASPKLASPGSKRCCLTYIVHSYIPPSNPPCPYHFPSDPRRRCPPTSDAPARAAVIECAPSERELVDTQAKANTTQRSVLPGRDRLRYPCPPFGSPIVPSSHTSSNPSNTKSDSKPIQVSCPALPCRTIHSPARVAPPPIKHTPRGGLK
jgi:hypothetical protein